MHEDRVCLDYLLRELRMWQREERLPQALVQPLLEDYSARRAALDPPRPLPPVRIPPQEPPARKGVAAFLEERNIATLHLVGSLLLLTGLVLLVQWQWAGIGRFLLLAVLALAALGLLRMSDQLQAEHPLSARVLGVLGVLLVPLCGIAVRVFGLVGALSWPLTTLLAAALSAGVCLWRLRTRGEPVLIGLLAAAGAGMIWGGAGLLPGALGWPTGITGLLALATLSFWGVGRGKPEWDLPRTLSGHALTLMGVGSGLLWAAQAGGTAAQLGLGLTLLGAGGVYGVMGSRLQLLWLDYAAASTVAVGAQLLLPESATLVARSATLAATGALALLLARFRGTEGTAYRRSAEGLTMLGLLPLLLEPRAQDVPLVTLFVAQGLFWYVVAADERGRWLVSLHALSASRLLAIPLDSWFVSLTHAPANELRWLLIPALGLGLTKQNRVASGTLAWVGAGQLTGLFSDKTAASSAVVLSVEALGLGAWGLWQGCPRAARWALAPLSIVMLAQWLWWFFGTPLLPLPIFALSLALVGATLARSQDLGLRGLLWLLAAAHLAAGLLPTPLLPFWPLALVPPLLWLNHADETDGKRLRLVEFFTPLCFLAGVLLPSEVSPVSLVVTGSALSLLVLRRRPQGVFVSAALATATLALSASGFPHPHLTLPQVGLLLAGAALFWQALAALLQRRTALWEALSATGVAVTGFAILLALLGLGIANQGRWTILALLVSAAALGAAAGLQRCRLYIQGAFACAFTAYGLYFYDRFGLDTSSLDGLFLPLGLYLLFVAERERETTLRPLGLFGLLGTAFLAVLTAPHAWGHALLLTAECLIAMAVGISQRVKVYLGGGLLFLVALLVSKLWDPLRELNFGVYLTLLGLGVLVAAMQFERRREAVRRWAALVHEAYQRWD